MKKYNIGIDSASNGVFLDPGFHAPLHTNAYFDAVNDLMLTATSRTEALEILSNIGNGLAAGRLP